MLSPDCVGGPRHGYPSSTSGKREGEPQGGRRENQLSPDSWPLSEPGPRMEGDCWCRGGGGLSRKQKRQASPTKKKHQKSKGPWPLPLQPSPPHTKKCKTLSQNGGLRGAPNLGSRGPCPSPALPRTPRPARSGPGPRGPHGWPEAGPGSGRAMSCRCPVGANPPTRLPSTQSFHRPLLAPVRGSEP